jgi:RNA recognition motif-containing protein
LEDVLKKLSPEDAATVKHYFAQRNGMASKYGTPQQKPQASPIVRQPSAVDIALDPEKSLRANLQKMALIDPSCIITVRKINKLGLTSPYALKAYFKQFGPVEEVFVTHAVAKPNYEGEKMRMRPAGMGFVAFAKAEDALAVLNEQREHVIRGTSISVCTYEPRPAKEVRAS